MELVLERHDDHKVTSTELTFRTASRALLALFYVCGISSMVRSTAFADVALPIHVEESFNGRNVQLSGTVLVGLALGGIEGVADPAALRVPIRSLPPGTHLCLSALTRDGAYSMQGSAVVPDTIGDEIARLRPSEDWKYRAQLERYERAGFAALIRYGGSCAHGSNVSLMPVMYDNRIPKLTVALNAQRALSVAAILIFSDSHISASCHPIAQGSRGTAFNYLCDFPLDASHTHGKAHLTVQLQDVDEKATEQFSLLLP